MAFTATMDELSFMSWHDRFIDELNYTSNQFLMEEMRGCLKKCIDWTPPSSLAKGRVKPAADFTRASEPASAGGLGQRVRSRVSQGRLSGFDISAIEAGGESTFVFQMARLNRMIEKRDYTGFNTILKNMHGNISRWEAVPFSESLFANASRTGAGGIKTQRKFVFEITAWRRQLAKVLSHVGRRKAGWLPAFYTVGGKDAPDWINKHAIGARGDFQVDRSKSVITMIATNYALGVQRSKEIVTRAMQSQLNGLHSRFYSILNNSVKK
jgi:hypothetical protein